MIKHTLKYIGATALMFSLFAANALGADENAAAFDMKVNDMPSPLAVENGTPRLSWALKPQNKSARNIVQTAYQIQAATSKKLLSENEPDLWDSGKTDSAEQLALYKGKIPQMGAPVYWRIRVWTNDEKDAGPWSKPNAFEFGMLEQEDWTGPWIGMDQNKRGRAAPYLRGKIELDKDIESARAYVCGLGWFELFVNGRQIGDNRCDPPQTDYEIRTMYTPLNITKALKGKGAQTVDVAVLLGDGWYNQDVAFGANLLAYGPPRLRAQFVFNFKDGTQKSVPADLSWQTRHSPIVSNNIYAGEFYDARLALSEKQMSGNDGWEAVVQMDPPGGIMVPINMPPERVIGEIKPVAVKKKEGEENAWVYDFGKNMTGWARLNVDVPEGTTFRIQFAEKMKTDGTVDYSTCGSFATLVNQIDVYIAHGAKNEKWEPSFTNHGFQYVELFADRELEKEPDENTLTAIMSHTDLPVVGRFECSDEQLNRLHEVAVHTYLMGAHALPMDCPVRERCGWTGDAHVTSRMAMMNFDAAAFFRKYVEDIETGGRNPSNEWRATNPGGGVVKEQKPANIPHMIAPGKRLCGVATPDWGSAIAFIPWEVYCATGDLSVLNQFLEPIQNWTDFLLSNKDENGLLKEGLGDWCMPAQSMNPAMWLGPVEVPITSSAMLIHLSDILSQIYALNGNAEKADYYAKLAKDTSTKLLEAYFKPEDLAGRSQTALGLTLLYTKDDSRNKELFDALVERSQDGEYFEAGVYGTPAMLEVFRRNGREDLAHRILTKESYPSYRAMLDMGATTLWEVWPNDFDEMMGSMCHPFHGGYDTWIYGTAGIEGRNKGEGPWIFSWYPNKNLTWAKASINPPAGKIASDWTRNGDNVTWTIEIPVNQQGQINIPAGVKDIRESGKKLEGIEKSGAKWLHKVESIKKAGGKDYTQLTVGSGRYEFKFSCDVSK